MAQLHDDPFDPASTRLHPLAEYRDRLPSGHRNRRLNRATLWRWALHGARSGTVRLRTVCIGGGRFTTDADVHAFMRALDRGNGGGDPQESTTGADGELRHRAAAIASSAEWQP